MQRFLSALKSLEMLIHSRAWGNRCAGVLSLDAIGVWFIEPLYPSATAKQWSTNQNQSHHGPQFECQTEISGNEDDL